MSDFLYSNTIVKNGSLTKEIQKIYPDDKPEVEEFHGKWGSLAVSRNIYNGFQPYENEDYLFVVIGGPVLYFMDNDFLKENHSNAGTRAIYTLWKNEKVKWDEDLSGPFSIIIVNKKNYDVQIVTDLMSFIPVYIQQDSTSTILSTHVDALASTAGLNGNFDVISCADFILHGVVTFPYTLYQEIYQVSPASMHKFKHNSNKLISEAYWIPKEEYEYTSIDVAANEVIKGLEGYVKRVSNNSANLAQFISGGEDSRLLSGLLQKYPRDAIVFLDYMNREGRIAKKAARAYGANFKLATRSKTHYIEILPNCSDLLGSGSQYFHAHSFGFHKSCRLNEYDAVFGGLWSDALLKGSRIKINRYSRRLPLIPDMKDKNYSSASSVESNLITKDILIEIEKRRNSHLNYVMQFRDESAEEWFELWPASMNRNIPNIHANRRLFKSYEPFLTKEIVKISSSVPQDWKLNRRLFHKAAKPLLKPTKWLFHSEGKLPYFSWHINSIIEYSFKLYRKMGLVKGNQGPWGDWDVIINSDEWGNSILENYKGFSVISSIMREQDIKKLLKNNKVYFLQRVNLMQVLYQLKNKK